MRPRQFGGVFIIPTEMQAFDQHVMARSGVVCGPPDDFPETSINHSDRIAPATGDLIMADDRERSSAPRVPKAIA